MTALCSAQPPGNPVGSLFWRWHFPPSPAPVAQRLPRLPFPLGPTPFDTNDFAQTIGHTEDVPTSFYAIYKQQDRLSSELVIPEIDRRYHSANLSCETAHATGVSMRTEQRIMVHCELFFRIANCALFVKAVFLIAQICVDFGLVISNNLVLLWTVFVY